MFLWHLDRLTQKRFPVKHLRKTVFHKGRKNKLERFLPVQKSTIEILMRSVNNSVNNENTRTTTLKSGVFTVIFEQILHCSLLFLFPSRANPTKWSNTLIQFVGNLPTNCVSVCDHFVRLALTSLTLSS